LLPVEKAAPHRKLSAVKALLGAGHVRTTRSARESAVALGLDFDGMLAVVMALTSADFHKSMTTHADHRRTCT
jgi:motility quorum-sensing regulator / GCU-specific mRNA interferase toxin